MRWIWLCSAEALLLGWSAPAIAAPIPQDVIDCAEQDGFTAEDVSHDAYLRKGKCPVCLVLCDRLDGLYQCCDACAMRESLAEHTP